MLFRKIVLFPFSLLYFLITSVRNVLYDKGIYQSKSFDFPVICVGNLKAGGTGKTPHVEFLAEYLCRKKKLTILSRGYGRKTKGFILASSGSKPDQIGDEPAQYLKNSNSRYQVAVGEDRVAAVYKLLELLQPEVILLDDAFQHRRIKAGLNILLTEFSDLFYEDSMLPGGMLRESQKGAARADVILITKCPDTISEALRNEIIEKVRAVAGNKPVFFTRYIYGEPVALTSVKNTRSFRNVMAFAGIANPDKFYNYLEGKYKVVKKLTFPDHKNYSDTEINNLLMGFKSHPGKPEAIFTTEKDGVKLAGNPQLENVPIFYIPVKVIFNHGGNEFLEITDRFVNDNTL